MKAEFKLTLHEKIIPESISFAQHKVDARKFVKARHLLNK